jgi:hypothetical protein
LRSIAVALGLGLLASVQADATAITTTSYVTWKSTMYQTGNPTELNFNTVGSSSYNTSSGITLTAIGNPAVTYIVTGPDNGAFKLTGGSFHSVTSLFGSADSGAQVKIAAPASGVSAFLLGVNTTGSTPITLTLSDSQVFSLASGLFGISISHPIDWMTLSTTAGSQIVLSDFWYGYSALTQDQIVPQTPEAATVLLTLGGLFLVFGLRRKQLLDTFAARMVR